MDKMREEFEAWFEADSMPLESNWFKKDDDGDYCLTSTDFAWSAWKASRAALCVELPENCKGMALTVDEFHKQLDKAGVTYK